LTEASNGYALGLRVNYHSSNIAVIGDSPSSLDLSFRAKARDYTALSRLPFAIAPPLRDNHGECILEIVPRYTSRIFLIELAVNYPANHFQTASSECVHTQLRANAFRPCLLLMTFSNDVLFSCKTCTQANPTLARLTFHEEIRLIVPIYRRCALFAEPSATFEISCRFVVDNAISVPMDRVRESSLSLSLSLWRARARLGNHASKNVSSGKERLEGKATHDVPSLLSDLGNVGN